MKWVKWLFFLLPALTLLAFPKAILAEAKTLDVAKDTYANQAYPDDPKGSIGSIIVSNKNTTRLGYLQFENLDLPEGAIFDEAVLNFYVHELHYSDRAKVNIGPITSNWEEATVTWNNKPTINQAQAIEKEFSLTAAGWRIIDITPLVHQWHEGTVEDKGLFVYPFGFLYGTAETEYAYSFKSKESGTQRANIVVNYHLPEPTPTETPTPSPSPTPTPEAAASPAEEEPTPTFTPEKSPTPTPEAEEKEGFVLGITPGQVIIAGLILLALLAAGVTAVIYSQRKPVKKPKTRVEKKAEKQLEEEKENQT